jgi:predicted transporter
VDFNKNKKLVNKINSKLKYIHLQELGGIALFICGAILIGIAIHAVKKISEAKDVAHSVTNFFQHNPTWNPIIKFFGGKAQEKISESYTPATIVMVAGIFLVVIGLIIFVYYRLRKSHPKS